MVLQATLGYTETVSQNKLMESGVCTEVEANLKAGSFPTSVEAWTKKVVRVDGWSSLGSQAPKEIVHEARYAGVFSNVAWVFISSNISIHYTCPFGLE